MPAFVRGERLMLGYRPYVEHLNELVEALAHDRQAAITSNAEAVQAALDGGAPAALRRLIAIDDRREAGAFFTSSTLSNVAWAPLLSTLGRNSVIVDPACGAGSLLIPGLQKLLHHSGVLRAANQIRGRDLVDEFAEATRARLALTVATSQVHMSRKSPRTNFYPDAFLFSAVQQGDGLKEMESLLDGATHVVLNPPYNSITAPESCSWGTGKINNAALFTEITVKHMPDKSRMVAILPEVLRSGPRYAKWRELIRQAVHIDQVTASGAFDAQTDVDVFCLYVSKRKIRGTTVSRKTDTRNHLSGQREFSTTTSWDAEQCVGYKFEISVGAVVPHRHPEVGPVSPFATARELPAWGTVSTLTRERSFTGRRETPPFVAIRRTSRPGQMPRAIATVVAGTECVAVDNHIIVARPIDGSLAQCEKLLELLKSSSTTQWLDERYRCHHLPVEAIKLIPWANEEGETDG